jgi:molecular chaperone GrpE
MASDKGRRGRDEGEASDAGSGPGGAGGERAYDAGSDAEAGAEEFIERLESAERERDEANQKYLRTLAEFQNYQRRSLQNEQFAKAQGAAGVVQSVVNVIDHFDIALGQDPSRASAEQVISGVRLIRDELLRALQQHGVGLINPVPGDEFTPGRHEAVSMRAQDGVAPGRVVQTFQAGYTLAGGGVSGQERVLRPAKVVVAPTE